MALYQGRGNAMAPLLLALTTLLLACHCCSAVVYNVGDRKAWSLPAPNYGLWTRGKRFHVNDILRFTYSSGLHNVVQVSRADYTACSGSRPLAVYNNGNTAIPLSRRGTYYFICGVPGHCQAGMKVQVNVV